MAALLAFISGCKTGDQVDVSSDMGTWYEIAANPVFVDKGLAGVTPNYSLNDDGTVTGINSGYPGSLDGEEAIVEGLATLAVALQNLRTQSKSRAIKRKMLLNHQAL